MSNPLGKRSRNSGDDFGVTKPKERAVDYQSRALHDELARILKTMVSQSISASKLPPEIQLQIILSAEDTSNEASDANVGSGTPVTVAHNSSGMTTDIEVNKLTSITFELPKDCIVDQIDMDKLHYVDAPNNNPAAVPVRRHSFSERLEEWSIELREHPNKTCDVLYHHSKSSKMFRSITEVVKFLLYEIYPDYNKNENMPIPEEDLVIQDKHMITEAPTVGGTFMSTSSGDTDEQERTRDRQIVEEFLRDSYNNLLNYRGRDFEPEPESEPESESESD